MAGAEPQPPGSGPDPGPPPPRNSPPRGSFVRLIETVEQRLFAPSPIAPLVYFRIIFGAIALWEVTRFFKYGWIEAYYIVPEFFFTYVGLPWIQPWSGNLMYVHFLALGILAVFIILGLWYRVSTTLFFVGFTYVFLVDQANYLNHFYLFAWVSFLLILTPAHRSASLDVMRRPELRAATVPAWHRWLLCAIVGIPYFFGGVAKINGDWLRGEPARIWMTEWTHFPVVGSFFAQPWAPYVFSYSGILFDLFVVPLLIWRRTRVLAVLMVIAFNLANANLFSIGLFPWFMLLATPIFFDPRRLEPILRFERLFGDPVPTKAALETPDRHKPVVMALLAVFAAFHILMPLRHHLYPGDVKWTEEGMYFSWHMLVRAKAGRLAIVATDSVSGESWVIDQRRYLTRRQQTKMVRSPNMIVLFAHYLGEELREEGHQNVEIHAVAELSLNGRPLQRMIDPTIDLTQVNRSLLHKPWILHLETPLPGR